MAAVTPYDLILLADAPALSVGGLAAHAALLLLLIVLSAVFSGSETALFSLTPAQLEQAAASANPLRRLAARLRQDPKRTLAVILLMNTGVNVLMFASSFVLFHGIAAHVGAWVTPVSAVLSVLLVVLFGEVTPKVLAVAMPERAAPAAAAVVQTASYVAAPIAWLIDTLLAEPFTRLFLGPMRAESDVGRNLSAADLKRLLDFSHGRGGLDAIETSYLREVVGLADARVYEVMVARVDIVAYDVNDPPEGLRAIMRDTRLKKVPVYDGAIDRIVGLVYAKVLFFNPDKPLRQVVSPVRFVPDIITAEQLLLHFRKTRSQFAIAVDEFGGVSGLVTLEDVMERIVGEIRQPGQAPEAPEVQRISEREYEVDARLSVRFWSEQFGLGEVSERVGTVGGLMAERLGRALQPQDTVRVRNLELTVLSMTGRRPDRIRLLLADPDDPEATGGPTEGGA